MGNRIEVTSSWQHVQLSGRDSLLVLNLLEKPPAPNAKLLAAAGALLSGNPSKSRNPFS